MGLKFIHFLLYLTYLIVSGAIAIEVDEDVLNKLVQRIENVEKENQQLKQTVFELSNKNSANKRFLVDSQEYNVAFSAGISSMFVSDLNPHQAIIFETTMTNVGGAYSNDSGVFIAPLPGTYMFSCSLIDHNDYNFTVHAEIVKSGGAVLGRIFARAEPYEHRDQGAQTVVTHLKAGDQVWVRIFDSAHVSVGGEMYSTFTGYLVYADAYQNRYP